MKYTKKALQEMKQIYFSNEFVARFKRISNAPIDSLKKVAEQFAISLSGKDTELASAEDPFDLESLFDGAEKGEGNKIQIILQTFIMDDGSIYSGDNESITYWGTKSIIHRVPTACALYVVFLMATGAELKIAMRAARYARYKNDVQDLAETMVNLYEQYIQLQPESYESKVCNITPDISDQEIAPYSKLALDNDDASTYLFLTFLAVERNVGYDKNELKAVCEKEKIPRLYELLTGEKSCGNEDYIFDECILLSKIAYCCAQSEHREYFVRAFYLFCNRFLDGGIDPFADVVLLAVQERPDYDEKNADLATILHALYISSRQKQHKSLEESALNLYRQVLARTLVEGGFADCPKLDEPVNEERLKRVFYFNAENVVARANLGEIVDVDPNGCNISAHFALTECHEIDSALVCKTTISIPECGDGNSAQFVDAQLNGCSNMVGKGLVRSLASIQTKVTVVSSLHIDKKEYAARFHIELPYSFDICNNFTTVDIQVDEAKTFKQYLTLSLTLTFSPFDDEVNDDVPTISFDLGKLLAEVDKQRDGEDVDDFIDEEESVDEDYFDSDDIEDWGDVTTYNGECSAFVKFSGKAGYKYNYNGSITIGDKVKVSGKLAGTVGTVERLDEWDDSPYMQEIIEVLSSDDSTDAASPLSVNAVANTDTNREITPTYNDVNVSLGHLIFQKPFSFAGKTVISVYEFGVSIDNASEKLGSKTVLYKDVRDIRVNTSGVGSLTVRTRDGYAMLCFDEKDYDDVVVVVNLLKEQLLKVRADFNIARVVVEKLDKSESTISSKGNNLATTNIANVQSKSSINPKTKSRKRNVLILLSSIVVAVVLFSILFTSLYPYDKMEVNGLTYFKNDNGTYSVQCYSDVKGDIIIPDHIRGVSVTSIHSFYSSLVTSVTIPETVTTIEDRTFSNCNRLTSVTIFSGVATIGDSAFEYCKSLKSVTISNGVISIGDSAFKDCSGLTSINISSNTTSIGNTAFWGCNSLTSIAIPMSVKKIGYNAFANCVKFEAIYYKGSPDDWAKIDIEKNNYELTKANRYYYSENRPIENGNYWHYGDDNEILIWD